MDLRGLYYCLSNSRNECKNNGLSSGAGDAPQSSGAEDTRVSTYKVGSEGGGRLHVHGDLTVCLELQVRGLPCHGNIFKSVLLSPQTFKMCFSSK